jgi:hypothetical protein
MKKKYIYKWVDSEKYNTFAELVKVFSVLRSVRCPYNEEVILWIADLLQSGKLVEVEVSE